MNAKDTATYLIAKGLSSDVAKKLESENITGDQFTKLTPELMRLFGFSGGQIVAILAMQSQDLDFSSSVNVESPDSDIESGQTDSDSESELPDEQQQSKEAHSALSAYMSDEELAQFGNYELIVMNNQLQRYQHALTFDGVNANLIKPYFVQNFEVRQRRKAAGKQPENRPTAVNEPQRKSSRVSSRQGGQSTSFAINNPLCDDNVATSTCSRNSMATIAINNSATDGIRPISTSSRSGTTSSVIHNPATVRAAPATSTASSSSIIDNSIGSSVHISCDAGPSGRDQPEGNNRDVSDAEQEDALEQEIMTDEYINQAVDAFLALPEEIPEAYKALKTELPVFDCLQILKEEVKKSKYHVKKTFLQLLEKRYLTRESRKCIVRILTRHLHFNHVSHANDVTTRMKEGMAKSFVCLFPKFAHNDQNSMPWCHMYNPKGPVGWLQNASRAIQKEFPTKKGRKRKAVNPIIDYTSEEEIEYLALLNTGRNEKNEVLKIMENTYNKRQVARQRGETITYFLSKYIHFLNFDGEVLNVEFKRLQPLAKDMCREFLKFHQKILALPSHRDVNLKFDHAVLKALLLLSQQLPHDIPCSADSWANFTTARETDIVVALKVGDDVEDFVFERREKSKGPVQPYILVVKSQLNNKILKIFLVLDSKAMEIPTESLLKGIDWLFKSIFVFNVKYSFGWRNTFHFLQTCFYNIYERSCQSNRNCDRMTASEFELLKILQAM